MSSSARRDVEVERSRRLRAQGLEIFAQAQATNAELEVEYARWRVLIKEARELAKYRADACPPPPPAPKRDLNWASTLLFDEAQEYRKRRAHLRVVK